MILRSELAKCRDCEFYRQTRTGKQGGVYGKCLIRNSRTDKSEARQGGCYACAIFKVKED